MRICSKFSIKCEASHNNKSKLFYAVRAGTEQEEIAIINNAVETLSLDKKKRSSFPYLFNLHSILHPQFLHIF